MFSKKATKIDKIFTVNLTVCSKCQIYGEDFVKLCGLFRKHELSFSLNNRLLNFTFYMKAPKIDKIFTIDLTLCSKCQIDSEDFVNFCGLLRKHKLYLQIFP